jgi:glycosyltransferase involved in cell wall biosynthesis
VLNILVVNWQDRENPQAGGAEIQLHELFGRLAARGHRVTLLCSGWEGCDERATLDGIAVHRVGTRYTFPFVARGYYVRCLRHYAYDVLVEDINKVPLWTPRWGARRVVALVPHLFGGTAFRELPAPMAALVWLAERPLAYMYRHTSFEAVSESTADDLAARGIPRDEIRVIYNGVDSAFYTPATGARAPAPVFAYLGRLKRYKGVDTVIRAFGRLARPDAVLEIAGKGDHEPHLRRLAASLDLGERVRFLGFISEAEKLALLRRAWALALASPKEGWGITNLEAAACGTPVIASDSPGIRESVRDGETGLLVPHGDVAAMAAAMERLAADVALVEQFGRHGRAFAETFTWDRAADETVAHLAAEVRQGGALWKSYFTRTTP